MRISNYEIKKAVVRGKGSVIFLTKEMRECGIKDRAIVTVEKDKQGKYIKIRPFSLKK